MRMFFTLFLGVSLVGCEVDDQDGDSGRLGDGGNDGTGADAYGCVEVSRTAVTDTAVAPEGFTFAADQVLTIAVGSFVGSATFRDSSGTDSTPVPATWTVGEPDAVWAIYRELRDGGGDTGGLREGAAWSGDCDPVYEADVALGLATDDGSLAEAWAGQLSFWDATGASTGGELDATALSGSLSPDFDPAAYDTATLSVGAGTTEAGWHGDLQWSASRDLGGGVGEGIVGPAGQFDVSAAE